MANVLLLIDDHYEDAEAIYPYYRMQEAGYGVTVAGAEKRTYHSKHGYPMAAVLAGARVRLRDYRAVIIPGGGAPDIMRTKPEMVRIVKEASEAGIVLAAICHGAQMLIEAGAARGKRATCYVSVKTDLINAGALYLDESVVADGSLITSRHPGDLPDFCRAILIGLGG